MNQDIEKNKLTHRTNGIVQIIISVGLIFFHGNLLYNYNFTSILYLVKIANWVLVLNILFGIIGLLIGLKTYKGKLKIWNGYIWIITFLIIEIALDTLTTS